MLHNVKEAIGHNGVVVIQIRVFGEYIDVFIIEVESEIHYFRITKKQTLEFFNMRAETPHLRTTCNDSSEQHLLSFVSTGTRYYEVSQPLKDIYLAIWIFQINLALLRRIHVGEGMI